MALCLVTVGGFDLEKPKIKEGQCIPSTRSSPSGSTTCLDVVQLLGQGHTDCRMPGLCLAWSGSYRTVITRKARTNHEYAQTRPELLDSTESTNASQLFTYQQYSFPHLKSHQ